MHRLILASVFIPVLVLLAAGPALASQCPKLIAQINSAAGTRFDNAAYEARAKAAEAQKLHNEGKHEESEKAAKDGLQKLGIKM